MGTFQIEITVKNLHDPNRHRTLPVLVDTGATYTTLPHDVVEALGCEPTGRRRVLLANGEEVEWPVAVVQVNVQGQEGPTFCLLGPNGGPALLGAVTLEELALGVDQLAKKLLPVQDYLTRLRRGSPFQFGCREQQKLITLSPLPSQNRPFLPKTGQ